MPKRKREPAEADSNRASKALKQSAQDYFTQSLKLLHRALKTAKGFERQKLGKRLKLAKTKASIPEINRINKEIEVLKDLSLDKVGEAHLKKTLGKIKAFAESDGLQGVLGGDIYKPEGEEEDVTAWRNVVSGMCNMKQVKEVVDGAVGGMYNILGLERPVKGKQKPVKVTAKEVVPEKPARIEVIDPDDADTEESVADEDEPAWDGFSENGGSGNVDQLEREPGIGDDVGEGEEDDIAYQSLEEDDIDRYEALLGESSSEEEEAEEEQDIWAQIRASIPKTTTAQKPFSPSISLSPEPLEDTPMLSQSEADSESESDVELQPKPVKVKRQKAPPPSHNKASTFLPTLMGGYWSGTDSSASDLEDDPKSRTIVRKNRPGQSARRALWEKKYKDKANHIASGQGSLAEQREATRDPKKGARSERGRGGRWRGEGRLTGGNMTGVGNGSARGGSVQRPEPRKDDAGPLHPSWQAAKKAKSMEKTAKFEGKKVVF